MEESELQRDRLQLTSLGALLWVAAQRLPERRAESPRRESSAQSGGGSRCTGTEAAGLPRGMTKTGPGFGQLVCLVFCKRRSQRDGFSPCC